MPNLFSMKLPEDVCDTDSIFISANNVVLNSYEPSTTMVFHHPDYY